MSRHAAEDGRRPWPEGTRDALAAAGLDPAWARDLVDRALREDLGPELLDVTTLATIPATATGSADVVARDAGVVAGLVLVPVVLAETAAALGRHRPGVDVPTVEVRLHDGSAVTRGDVVARLSGSLQVLLVAERTLLNLVCRASGIATHTRRWADVLAGSGATVLDTRKTTPGLRPLEKYAVRCGGGTNKRMGLYDVAMVKDNHKFAAGSLTAAYQAIRERFPQVDVQVEAETPEEAEEAVRAGARFLLLDNMTPDVLREAVTRARAAAPEVDGTRERVECEATGGLTLEVAAQYAATGVDYLSVGGLTHSSPVLDLALDLVVD